MIRLKQPSIQLLPSVIISTTYIHTHSFNTLNIYYRLRNTVCFYGVYVPTLTWEDIFFFSSCFSLDIWKYGVCVECRWYNMQYAMSVYYTMCIISMTIVVASLLHLKYNAVAYIAHRICGRVYMKLTKLKMCIPNVEWWRFFRL